MALTTTSNRVVATGDGATTVFAFNRLLYDATHLQVYLAGVLQSSGYTVSGVPGSSTSVTFSVAPGSGVQVLLLRVVPLTQLSVYAVGGAFPAATTEKNLDLLMMANQQFDEVLDRAVTLPVTSTLTAANLPDPALAANYGKGVKIAGDGSGLDTFNINAGNISGVVTTKGDIHIFGATTEDRLAVGTNGQVLVADSSQAKGLKWTGDLPDNVFRVVGSSDATKKVALEVDGLTTGTTRTVTVPDRNLTLSDPLTLGTEQATTSGTSIDFTGIPAWVKRITIMLVNVSTNGTDGLILQIGDSGGFETTGYTSEGVKVGAATSTSTITIAFAIMADSAAAAVINGAVTLTLENASNFTWVESGNICRTDSALMYISAGSKSLSATLDRVRITTSGGVNTFDAGAINIMYE